MRHCLPLQMSQRAKGTEGGPKRSKQAEKVHSWTQRWRNKSLRLQAPQGHVLQGYAHFFFCLLTLSGLRFGDIFKFLSLSPRQLQPHPTAQQLIWKLDSVGSDLWGLSTHGVPALVLCPCSSNTLVVRNRGVLSQQSRRSPWKRERGKKKGWKHFCSSSSITDSVVTKQIYGQLVQLHVPLCLYFIHTAIPTEGSRLKGSFFLFIWI